MREVDIKLSVVSLEPKQLKYHYMQVYIQKLGSNFEHNFTIIFYSEFDYNGVCNKIAEDGEKSIICYDSPFNDSLEGIKSFNCIGNQTKINKTLGAYTKFKDKITFHNAVKDNIMDISAVKNKMKFERDPLTNEILINPDGDLRLLLAFCCFFEENYYNLFVMSGGIGMEEPDDMFMKMLMQIRR